MKQIFDDLQRQMMSHQQEQHAEEERKRQVPCFSLLPLSYSGAPGSPVAHRSQFVSITRMLCCTYVVE